MNFAYYANLRAVELIFRGFGLTTAKSTYHKETFAKKNVFKLLQLEVTAECQNGEFGRKTSLKAL